MVFVVCHSGSQQCMSPRQELELERRASGKSGVRLRKTASMERHEAPVPDRGHITARASMRRSASAMPTRGAAADPEIDATPRPSPEDIQRSGSDLLQSTPCYMHLHSKHTSAACMA